MKMRTRITILIGALLLVFSGAARAQQEQSAAATAPTATPTTVSTATFTPKVGTVDFGFRANDVSGDRSRYQRFNDYRQGGYIDRFKFGKETETWAFDSSANNVGYYDQRYRASYESIGKLAINGEWNQVPLFISSSTATLYKDTGNGRMVIDDAVQRTIQNAGSGTPQYNALKSALNGANPYDLRARRDIGLFNLAYSMNQAVDLTFDVRNSNRTGYNLMSFGFGTSPGLSPVVEFNTPTDDRTTDIKANLEFATARGLFNVGYNASWFDQHSPTVQFDNPLRVDDISGGPSSGLTPMWPSNSSSAVTMNGSYKLGARNRASAFLSFGQWDQNQALVAPTVNTALIAVAPPLERPTAEAKADVTSMVYSFNSRPNNYLWLNARYRYFDYANKTPIYDTVALIGDWALGTALWENEPASTKRGTLDLDAQIAASRFFDVGFGYTREDGERTYRIYEKTAEDIYRVNVDSVANAYVTVRTKYEHSRRDGSGFEEELLAEVGEQPDTRHYDIANRTRDRVTVTAILTPSKFVNFNTSLGTGKDEYTETGFGLRNNDNTTWSLGADFIPTERVTFGLNYAEEKYTAMQYSRTANPLSATDVTFNDPTRDWWTDQDDKVKTFTASADFMKVLPRTDIRLGFDTSYGDATYVYNMKPEQKVFATVPLTQVSPLKNNLTNGRVDVQYFVRANVAIGATYLYERYIVDDFALGAQTLNSLAPANASNGSFASAVYSGYLYQDYKANTGWFRVTFLW
jgi:MtrB/PioB family decaheme-associated outer membrane protein